MRTGLLRTVLPAVLALLALGAGTAPAHADTVLSGQWHLTRMQAQEMWRTSTGAGVTVALVDTRVREVPELAGRLLPGNEDYDPFYDIVGHDRDDLNYSTYDFGSAGDELRRDSLFAKSSDGSERTDFGEAASRRFMGVVAADEEGWKPLSSAQQVYGASGLKAFGAEH